MTSVAAALVVVVLAGLIVRLGCLAGYVEDAWVASGRVDDLPLDGPDVITIWNVDLRVTEDWA
jgi:hypothetical protein